jgi:L-asparagine transporter-like permease
MSMGKWTGYLLVALFALGVVGLLVDAARAIAGVLLVVCLAVLAVRWFARRKT